MAAIPSVIFNAGTIPAPWTGFAPADGVCLAEDSGGRNGIVLGGVTGTRLRGGQPAPSAMARIQAALDAGDFDYVVVLDAPWSRKSASGARGFAVQVYPDPAVRTFDQLMGNDWFDGAGSFPGIRTEGTVGGAVAQAKDDYWSEARWNRDRVYRRLVRLRRVGVNLFSYAPDYRSQDVAAPFAWLQSWTQGSWALGASGGLLCITCDDTQGIVVRSFHDASGWTNGIPSTAAAPTNGVAASSPMGAGYGVAFAWDAPGATVARTVEVMTATDAAFTTGVRVVVIDSLASGEAATFRRACALGETLYAKARWIDEIGQPGAWSSGVSAVALGGDSPCPQGFTIPPGPAFTIPPAARFDLGCP